jgi:hypothetical protein
MLLFVGKSAFPAIFGIESRHEEIAYPHNAGSDPF